MEVIERFAAPGAPEGGTEGQPQAPSLAGRALRGAGAVVKGIGDVSTAAVKPFFRAAALGDLYKPTDERGKQIKAENEQMADTAAKLVGETVPFAALTPAGGAAAGGLAAASKAGPIVRAIAPALGRATASGGIGAAQNPDKPLVGGLLSAGGSLVGDTAPAIVSRVWQGMLHPMVTKAARGIHAGREAAREATHEAGQAASRGAHAVSEAGELAATEAARATHEAGQAAAGARHAADAQLVRRTQEVMGATLHKMAVQKIAERVGKALPELAGFGDDLFNLSRGEAGKKVIDETFGAAKAAIQKRIGAGKLWVPEINPSEPITLEAATEALTMLGGRIGNAPSAVARSAGQGQAAFNYGAAREQMVQALDMVSPGTGAMWDAAMKQRSAARAYMTLVSKSLDSSGVLDLSKLARNYNTFYGSLQRKLGPYYDEVTTALLQGPKGKGAVKVPPKAQPAEPKAFTPEPFQKPAPAGRPDFKPEPFKPEPFEHRGVIESLLAGPQAPYAQIGNVRVPVTVPPKVPAALSTLGGAFPLLPLGAASQAGSIIGLPHIPGLRRRGILGHGDED